MLHLFNIPYLITTYGYAGIFLIIFLESGIFFALPGDSLLFTAGLFVKTFGLSLALLIFLVFIATVLGSIAGYYIGFHLKKLQRYAFFRKIIKQDHLDKAHEFFEKHGRFAVFFSHFFPILRTFVPIVAGIAEMHYMVFLRYTLISAIAWAGGVTLVGYFFGQLIPNAKDYLSIVLVLTVSISLIPFFVEFIKSRKNKK